MPVAGRGPATGDRITSGKNRRNLLAGELHDSIGHTLTTSTIQAAVARQLMESDPPAARRALDTILDSSRAALDDLDHVLGSLRAEPADRRS